MLVAAITIALGALLFVRPLTRDEHAADATPSPPPLAQVATVAVPAGARACLDAIVLDAGSQIARFRVGTFGRPGPALAVTTGGRRYRVAGGYPDNAALAVALRRPAHDVPATFCVVPRGRVALYASDELRTRSRVSVTVAGRRVRPDVTLTLDRARPRSVLDELGSVVARATRWRPGVAPWFVWLLMAAVLVGVPAGTLWALAQDAVEPGGEALAPDVGDDVAR